MRFDIVVGNPPYNNGMDLDFIDLGCKISNKYCCMIVPAKWQTTSDDYRGCASKNLDYAEFRKRWVPYMSHVTFYPYCNDVFNIQTPDGVSYFLIGKEKQDVATVTNICNINRHFNSSERRSILNRESLLNFGNSLVDYLGNYKVFQISDYDLNKRYQVWVTCMFGFIRTSGIWDPIGTTRIIDSKHEVSEVYMSDCIFSSDDKQECEYFISWFKTRFTRFFFVMNVSKLTRTATDDCFRFIPIPPNNKFDHKFTEQELYDYYKIPDKYIEIIESSVRYLE